MSLFFLIPPFLLYLFGVLNLFGVRPDLVLSFLSFGLFGLILYFLIKYLQVHQHFFRTNAFFFYIILLVLLIATYMFGTEAKGSRRWLNLYFFQLQTSEIFKIFIIVLLAKLFSQATTILESRTLFLKVLIATIIPTLIIFKQPDLGTALIILIILGVMVLHSAIPRKQIIIAAGLVLLLLPLGWFGMQDYQKMRVISFINPQDISGAAYNMIQSKIAIGSGAFFGKGIGLGKQSQLMFLPEFHTDFAFASLVEQLGFIGGAVVITLYALFILFLFYKMSQDVFSSDEDRRYKFYYLLGFTTLIAGQMAINIGMNLGLLPVAGITLPFISYGGSSLITFIIGLAMIPE